MRMTAPPEAFCPSTPYGTEGLVMARLRTAASSCSNNFRKWTEVKWMNPSELKKAFSYCFLPVWKRWTVTVLSQWICQWKRFVKLELQFTQTLIPKMHMPHVNFPFEISVVTTSVLGPMLSADRLGPRKRSHILYLCDCGQVPAQMWNVCRLLIPHESTVYPVSMYPDCLVTLWSKCPPPAL